MAIGTKQDFKIYQEQFWGGFDETLMQNANAFNAASRNGLQLITLARRGDFEQEAFWQLIPGLVTRRDINSTATVTDLKMTQGEFVGPKINRKIGPVAQTRDAFRKIQQDPAQMSFLLGQQWAVGVLIDQLHVVVESLVAAIGAQASAVFDNTGTASPGDKATFVSLVGGLEKFGDASNDIICWVMPSKPFYDLMRDAIGKVGLDTIAGVTIATGTVASLGRPVVLTDEPAMVVTGTPNSYWILGLTAGGGVLMSSEEREITSFEITGTENLAMRYQGEYAYNVRLKGYAWDMAAGGINPLDTALATGTNWPKVVTDIKSTAGVLIKVH